MSEIIEEGKGLFKSLSHTGHTGHTTGQLDVILSAPSALGRP